MQTQHKHIFVSAIFILNSINETQHVAVSQHDRKYEREIQRYTALLKTRLYILDTSNTSSAHLTHWLHRSISFQCHHAECSNDICGLIMACK